MSTENLKSIENDEFELKATCINNSEVKNHGHQILYMVLWECYLELCL